MRVLAIILLSVVTLTATAFACGWMGTTDSVRFNIAQSERDMGRLPPLPTLDIGINSIRASWEPETDNYDYEKEQAQAEKVDALWNSAQAAEQEGKLSEVRSLLREYLEKSAVERTLYIRTDRQERRNSAIDSLDALSALDHGSNPSRVQAYLKARYAHDKKGYAEVQHALNEIGNDANLKDNAAYLLAAQLYKEEKFDEAARDFGAIVRRYPQSEKREAALFMASVATMKTSSAFTPTSGDEAHLHEYDDEETRHPVEIDKPWREALAGFERVMTAVPARSLLRRRKRLESIFTAAQRRSRRRSS